MKPMESVSGLLRRLKNRPKHQPKAHSDKIENDNTELYNALYKTKNIDGVHFMPPMLDE